MKPADALPSTGVLKDATPACRCSGLHAGIVEPRLWACCVCRSDEPMKLVYHAAPCPAHGRLKGV